MQLDRPLRVLTPTLDGDVLAVLAVADARFTAPTVHRLIGRHSQEGVRKALRRLVEQGIVISERVGRADVYRFNPDHLAAGPVVELANLFARFLERLRAAVAGWVVPPELVVLFGSAANGEMRSDSDIDVFVVGADEVVDSPTWRAQLEQLERAATSWTGNDTRVFEYSLSDLSRGPDAVIDEIREVGIHIAGDRSLLRPTARLGR